MALGPHQQCVVSGCDGEGNARVDKCVADLDNLAVQYCFWLFEDPGCRLALAESWPEPSGLTPDRFELRDKGISPNGPEALPKRARCGLRDESRAQAQEGCDHERSVRGFDRVPDAERAGHMRDVHDQHDDAERGRDQA